MEMICCLMNMLMSSGGFLNVESYAASSLPQLNPL